MWSCTRHRYVGEIVRALRWESTAAAPAAISLTNDASPAHRDPSALLQTLREIVQHKKDYPFLALRKKPRKTIVIDFSSPNIAKPFHAGHLRSTVLGNFIANLHNRSGHRVHRVNYLGDWGTQCGIVLAALEAFGSEEQLQTSPLQHLLELYVKGSELDKNDAEFNQRARSIFAAMEAGDVSLSQQWSTVRDLSLRQYDALYKRIGVEFDETSGESLYAHAAREAARHLTDALQAEAPADEVAGEFGQRLLKTDGSSLYLSRDLAALLDRARRLNFDEMLYVVENAQTEHFQALFQAAQYFPELKNRTLQHVKFGRIRGLSTRKGQVVLLSDLLDELQQSMKERMGGSKTTKVPAAEVDAVAEALALSLIIVNDFQQSRTHDYDNARGKLQQVEGDTGLFLQYCHARICSLERSAGVNVNENCDVECLREEEALAVLQQLAAVQSCVERAGTQLEPVHIVRYLFQTAHLSNRAMRILRVKNQPKDVAEARLLLFHGVRLVMAALMEVLGLRPLQQM
ncbi:probable arginine--tRNA ligase, mitochondrial [Paramacrobiotus metropolitanus]|uniref:probable arginine--tRNA ligase, mitochondrial n=1 Tax=Paramacrobiotus metropolitanus TaxID=2943436 RepID=UPI0024459AEE|nr:probable arginine--tRNA ligase, mitochondrial [Paramacrobiotus metropolitanus]